jgi:hypothetical protein
MTDKTPHERVRAQRPDLAAGVATKLDSQGHTTGKDNDKATGETSGVVASPTGGTFTPDTTDNDSATEGLPEPTPPEDIPEPVEGGTPHFHPPFSVLGNIVQDSRGRTVAVVGAPHMVPATRAKAALWIAGKLNA